MEDWYHLYRYTASTFGHSRASSVGSYTHEELAGLAGLGMVTLQPTSTEDATVTALNKEKLEQEVEREKRVEERFRGAVEGLGSEREEAFRLARDSNSSDKEEDAQSLDMPEVRLDPAGYPVDPLSVALQSLDASRVRLDNAYLVGADLRRT